MRYLLIIILLVTAGCWSPNLIHQNEGLQLSQAGSEVVSNEGFTLRLWFDLTEHSNEYKETIQVVGLGYVEGWESHRQPMWIPDYQTLRTEDNGKPKYRHRTNTVAPGKTQGAPWITAPSLFKGVVMIDGWLDEYGKPLANKTYFWWGGNQGGRIVELREDWEITYSIEWWNSYHPDNPHNGALLKLTVEDKSIEWRE